jgi:hypothetical protein
MRFDFTETHEHPEGGDRGGFAPETHFFLFEDGKATHKYSLDCNDSGPGGFGLDESTLQRLTTREDALGFVSAEVKSLRQKLAEAEECERLLREAKSYEDAADYSDYEDEDEDEDEDEVPGSAGV